MAGEVIGLDGIVNDNHTCDAIALEDSEVCIMPFDRIEATYDESLIFTQWLQNISLDQWFILLSGFRLGHLF
jgi:CRP-like cAMP-binding protein